MRDVLKQKVKTEEVMEKEELLIRRLALEILMSVSQGEEFSHILIKNVLDKYDYLDGRKKALLKRLVKGCLERKLEMEYVIGLYSRTPLDKCKPVIRHILILGAYQILYMDHVYDTLACNLSVELAKKKGLTGLSGFVNGVLRSIARNKESIPYPRREDGFISYASVVFSTPAWMVELLVNQYGEETTQRILQSSLEEEELTVRITGTAKGRIDEIKKEWVRAGALVEESGVFPFAFRLQNTNNPATLYGYGEGYFTMMDISSMCVAEFYPIGENAEVLDLCASPGGKSLHMAEYAGKGHVASCDKTEYKVERIRENVNRLNAGNVLCMVNDALTYREEWKEQFDVVIADVPCSGLGVMGRKPEMKYRLNEEGLKELMKLQRAILENATRYVKKGGLLLYSTCTLNREENDGQVQSFIKEKEDFEVIRPEGVPPVLESAVTSAGTLQLIQGVHPCDGFFVAGFRRNQG